MTLYRKYFKRMFDVSVALCAIVLLAPLMGAIAFVVYASAGRPIIFKQRRPGWRARPFTLYKFRTMSVAVGTVGDDKDRLTLCGRWLRSTSLDELPELWNVVRGDMSLVGPRPLLMEYVPLYSPEQARRHDVRPGITGLAQVSGRNAVEWTERFRLDVLYTDKLSMWLDFRIILTTILRVARREGISQPGRATMEPFRG